MVAIVDAHCHLDMLDDAEQALERARAAGVVRAVTIGVDAASNEYAVEAAGRWPDVWATVGLHPHDAKDRSDAVMARLRELAAHERVVGVGEAGLDYHYDNSPREQQRASFAEQIRLADEVGKALVIHSRDAWDDTFEILAAEGVPERFVFHCFTGGPREAERALLMGAVLSFSGIVSFKNAHDLREAARVTPLDRLTVETDSPFLTPAPFRGERNEPARVVRVAEAVAETKDVPLEAVAEASTGTVARLFGWADLG